MGVKVRKKGNDWWIFINHQGKRKSRKVGSKSAANALARTIEVELAAGRFGLTDDEERPKAFKDYCKEWLEVVMPTECEKARQAIIGL